MVRLSRLFFLLLYYSRPRVECHKSLRALDLVKGIAQSHDGKGANGSKNRPHDAYPVRCRVPGYYEPCSERLRVCQLNKSRQLKKTLLQGVFSLLFFITLGLELSDTQVYEP